MRPSIDDLCAVRGTGPTEVFRKTGKRLDCGLEVGEGQGSRDTELGDRSWRLDSWHREVYRADTVGLAKLWEPGTWRSTWRDPQDSSRCLS